VAGQAMLERVVGPLLRARAALCVEYATLHRELLRTVREDEVCTRLMTIPGVGAVVAMTFRSAIDQPEPFAHSKAVGAHFGLTPRKYQSGEIDRTGGISMVSDAMVRTALFEAANVMLSRAVRVSALKAWALRVASREGAKKAKVALARKLAFVMHCMRLDGTEFRWGRQATPAAAARAHAGREAAQQKVPSQGRMDRAKPLIPEWPVLRGLTTRVRASRGRTVRRRSRIPPT
jgi:transposase